MSDKKKDIPQWLKYAVMLSVGVSAREGYNTISTDSPVHFGVEGTAPIEAPEWHCEPEGGIIGAPMVCRPAVTDTASTDAKTE